MKCKIQSAINLYILLIRAWYRSISTMDFYIQYYILFCLHDVENHEPTENLTCNFDLRIFLFTFKNTSEKKHIATSQLFSSTFLVIINSLQKIVTYMAFIYELSIAATPFPRLSSYLTFCLMDFYDYYLSSKAREKNSKSESDCHRNFI